MSPLALVMSVLVGSVLAFIVWVAATAEPSLHAVLLLEESPIAWLTSVLLAMSAAAALVALSRRTPRWRYALLATGAAMAALDERFMGHEQLKEWILFNIFDGDLDAMGIWGDLPMLLYAVVALAVLWPLLRAPPHPWARPLWIGALALASIAVLMDVALPVHPWHSVEEILEVLAATALLSGVLASGAEVVATQ